MPRKMKKVLPPSTARVLMRKPDDLSELAQYVHDHQDEETGEPSTRYLVLKFQSTCKHKPLSLAKSGNYAGVLTIDVCTVCGATHTLGKPTK